MHIFQYELFLATLQMHLKGSRDVSLRQCAKESGISASTLSRLLSRETVPSLKVFVTLCSWMHTQPTLFFEAENEEASPQQSPIEELCQRILGCPGLPANVRESLVGLVKVLLDQTPQKQNQ